MLNTCHFQVTLYCTSQAGELAESVAKIIDPQYAEGVDMSEVQVSIISYSNGSFLLTLILMESSNYAG